MHNRVKLSLGFIRKQSWLWMQGDIFRAKQKERERLVGKERTSPGVSRILSTLDDMKINDAMLDDNFNETHHYDNRFDDEEVSRTLCSHSPFGAGPIK